MLTLPVAGVFALYGAWLARKRQGALMDILQYGAGFFLLGLIVGTALTIGMSRFL